MKFLTIILDLVIVAQLFSSFLNTPRNLRNLRRTRQCCRNFAQNLPSLLEVEDSPLAGEGVQREEEEDVGILEVLAVVATHASLMR